MTDTVYCVTDRRGNLRMETLRADEAFYRARRVHGLVTDKATGKVVRYADR